MKNTWKLLCTTALVSSASMLNAQTEVQLTDCLSMYPEGMTENNIWEYWDTWEPGKLNADDNFFIARTKLKSRFENRQTQVNPEFDPNGRKMFWWMPISNGSSSLSYPAYSMRNDNFNMWQYLDVHGSWNQHFFRSEGSFTDAAFKNGVRNGVLMFFDSGGLINYKNPGNNKAAKMFALLFKQDEAGKFTEITKLIKLMKYYGISGLTFNAEASMTQETAHVLQDFLAECHEEAARQGWGDHFYVGWYDSMDNRGNGMSFGMNALDGNRLDWFRHRTSNKKIVDHWFTNYNNTGGSMNLSINTAKSVGRSPYDVFAGQHIGTRGVGEVWREISERTISIGTWGEHSQNNIFYSSSEMGPEGKVFSSTYDQKQEMFFSGGNRNPAASPDGFLSSNYNAGNVVPLTIQNFRKFHGMAKMMPAQSSITELPFITNFSTGKGESLYIDGKCTGAFHWYNLGMQDYMPTWRWWVIDDQGNVPADAIKCELSYDEAYTGGSSLKLAGATSKSNVHLYKTKLAVNKGVKASLVYKVKQGTEPKFKLSYALEGSESKIVTVPVKAAQKANEWTTVTWDLADWGISSDATIALLGVSVENTESDYEAYIGGLSLVDPATSYQPVKPVLRTDEKSFVRYKAAFNYEPFKLIWDSKIDADPWNVVYNEDVDTWYFEVVIREDNAEAVKVVNRTTSWAALTVAEVTPTCQNFQVGVRAVAPDGKTRSEIAWLEQELAHTYEYLTGIVYEAKKLVPGDEFTVSLEDPTIPTATWKLKNDEGTVIETLTGNSITASIDQVGIYDLEVSFNKPEPGNLENVYTETHKSLIQITPEITGKNPIADFTISNQTPELVDGKATISLDFIGEKGEGFSSSAIEFKNGSQFFSFDPSIIGKPSTITFAAWIKPSVLQGQVLSLRVLDGNPSWGSVWVYIEGNPSQFVLMGRNRGQDFKDMFSNVPVLKDNWYHVAYTLDRNNGKVVFYINGIKVNEQDVFFKANEYDLYSLGTEGFMGTVDEIQIWDKVLSPEEIKVAMYGYEPNKVPDRLQGYWVFENRVGEEGVSAKKFPNLGKKGTAFPGGCWGGTTMNDNELLEPNMTAGSSWLGGNVPLKTSMEWSFPNAETINLDDPNKPVVTYNAPGEYECKLTMKNVWGTSVKTVMVTVTEATSVGTISMKDNVTVYPTAFEKEVNVRIAEGGEYMIKLYNLTGAMVALKKVNCMNDEVVMIDTQIPAGNYMLTVDKDGIRQVTTKVVKLK